MASLSVGHTNQLSCQAFHNSCNPSKFNCGLPLHLTLCNPYTGIVEKILLFELNYYIYIFIVGNAMQCKVKLYHRAILVYK